MHKVLKFCPIIWTIVCSILVFVHGAPTIGEADESVNIRGGEPASPGEFPFIVSVQVKSKVENQPNDHICGATLYNMSRIITAASCVQTRIASNFVVVAGAHLINEAILGHQQDRNIAAITLHPNFDPFADILHDDIAVVDLVSPFDATSTVTSLPMARRSQQYSGDCVIAGWGASNYNGDLSETLMKGKVTIHSRSLCANAYPGEYDENFQLCANGINGQGQVVDACNGDLGGPLICSNDDGSMYLAGVSSYGHMCGSEQKPGVYMEIAKYRHWLDSLIFGGGSGETTPPTTTTTTTTTSSPPSDDPVDDNDDSTEQEDQVANKPVNGLC